MRKLFEAYIRNLISFKENNPGEEKEEEEEKEEKKEGEGEDEDDEEALIALLSKLFGSNIKDKEEKKEFFDSEEEFCQKLDRVAEWMRECKHIIFFTGAGISTRYRISKHYYRHSFYFNLPVCTARGFLTIVVAWTLCLRQALECGN